MGEVKISSAAAAPDFSFTLARVAVAQVCQSVGYTGAQRPALEALADIATRYLKAVAKLSTESANSSGRTQSNLFDIIAAIEDLTSVEGFNGSWRVRSRSLWRSAAIRNLMRLFKSMDRTPFAQPLPPKRSWFGRERVLKNRDNSGWYNEGRLKHVPRWLPAVEESGEAEEREEEVKWEECLKREEAILGRNEMNRLKRECCACDEVEQVLSVKRGKVIFKIGGLGKLR